MDALVMSYQGIFYMFVPDWFYVHGVALLAGFVLLASATQFPESPKYMYANRRYDETREILKIIAKKNRASVTNEEIDNILFEYEGIADSAYIKNSVVEEDVDPSTEVIRLEGKMTEICTIREIRTNWLCLMTILSSICFCFFLINFQMKQIPGDLISITVVSSLAEFTAGCLASSLYLKLGDKVG